MSVVRTRFPRTFELIDLIEERCDPNAYFREFESRVDMYENLERAWTAREGEFAALHEEAWNALKRAAKPHLLKKSNDPRGWTQLIDTLNEARGYIYLKSKGCLEPTFILKSKQDRVETPDLKGERDDGTLILCEVKTINISDDEVSARREIKGRSIEAELPAGLFAKLGKTLEKAISQLVHYDPNETRDRVALIIPNFDDFLGEYKRNY